MKKIGAFGLRGQGVAEELPMVGDLDGGFLDGSCLKDGEFQFQMMVSNPNFQIYQFQTLTLDLFEKIRLHCMGSDRKKHQFFFLKGKEIQVGNLHSMTFCIQFADWLITTLLNA